VEQRPAVFDWQDGVNNRQRAQSAGCLAHDGLTFYFQTVSAEGEGAFTRLTPLTVR
jgi:hypothetical protein